MKIVNFLLVLAVGLFFIFIGSALLAAFGFAFFGEIFWLFGDFVRTFVGIIASLSACLILTVVDSVDEEDED